MTKNIETQLKSIAKSLNEVVRLLRKAPPGVLVEGTAVELSPETLQNFTSSLAPAINTYQAFRDRGVSPEEIRERVEKRGFGVPSETIEFLEEKYQQIKKENND